MKRAEFEQEVLTMLGGNLVDVELDSDDLSVAFNRAKRKYKQYGSANERHRFVELQLVAGQRDYDIPEEINLVHRIIRYNGTSGLNPSNPFHAAYSQQLGMGMIGQSVGRMQDMLVYELTAQFQEDLNKHFVHDIPYSYDKAASKIMLLKQPMMEEKVFLECYLDLTDEEYMDSDWIIEWTTAECKTILGRAYSKFASVGAPGGDIGLDGQTLLQEAQQDMIRLREEISYYIDGDITGGYITLG